MKKIIFAVTVSICCLLTTVTASAQQGINVPGIVKESFANHFKDAQVSRWVELQNVYASTFKCGEEYRDAFFTKEGEFKGVGRYIPGNMLPMMVSEKIKDNFFGYDVFELYQYDCAENGLCFCAVLKSSKHELILKIAPDGDVVYSHRNKIKNNNDKTHDAVAINLFTHSR